MINCFDIIDCCDKCDKIERIDINCDCFDSFKRTCTIDCCDNCFVMIDMIDYVTVDCSDIYDVIKINCFNSCFDIINCYDMKFDKTDCFDTIKNENRAQNRLVKLMTVY